MREVIRTGHSTQDIRYTGKRAEWMPEALVDCRNYLGDKYYDILLAIVEQWELDRDAGLRAKERWNHLRMQFHFRVGISGPPFRALMHEAFRYRREQIANEHIIPIIGCADPDDAEIAGLGFDRNPELH